MSAAISGLVCAQSLPTNMVDLRYESFLKKPGRWMGTPGNEFGEQIAPQNGALSFNVVDVSIPGNNALPVEFRRTLHIRPRSPDDYLTSYRILQWWEPGLPKITASYEFVTGPVTGDTSRPGKVCSVSDKAFLSPPPDATHPDQFPANVFWNAPSLQMPDGSGGLLVYNQGLMPAPQSGGRYYWLTANMDYVSCLAALKNSGSSDTEEQLLSAGEGFLVRRADGTRYWFDWMATDRRSNGISTVVRYSGGTPALTPIGIKVANLAWYPSRVEDRYGNWVTYTYSNKANEPVKLDRIDSSDGRSISLVYANGVLSRVEAAGRTWNYAGTQVTNPDGSVWSYTGDFRPGFDFTIDRDHGSCYDPPSWSGTVNPDYTTGGNPGVTRTISVTSPSGATADFTIGRVMLGRSAVPGSCYASGYSMAYGLPSQTTEPIAYLGGWTMAVIQKSVTGPGVDPQVWKYNYQSDIWFSNTNASAGTSRTKILLPDGSLDTYVYGNAPYVNDGLLLSLTRSKGGVVKRVVNEGYLSNLNSPVSGFPKRIGWHPYADLNEFGAVFLRPKTSSVTTQDGQSYSWSVPAICGGALCLDAYGRPTTVVKQSHTP